jgi:hypothetical protein
LVENSGYLAQTILSAYFTSKPAPTYPIFGQTRRVFGRPTEIDVSGFIQTAVNKTKNSVILNASLCDSLLLRALAQICFLIRAASPGNAKL